MSFSLLRSGLLRPRVWRSIRRNRSTVSKEELGPEPPNGFLFNEKPLLPGEKRQKEPWENIWVYGMTFNLLLVIAIVAFKPDTSLSGWAKQKAIDRLAEAESADESETTTPTETESEES